NEIFLAVKVSKIEPEFKVKDEREDFEKMMTFKSRQIFSTSKNAYDIYNKLRNFPETKFFLAKAGIDKVGECDIPKEELLKQARELVVYLNGNYITEIDVVAA